jgi:general secretion pathway protein J
MSRSPRRGRRGMTLLEILVSLGVMAMVSLLLYGAFDSMSRGRKGETMRSDRTRQARDAMDRMQRELQSAFLSLHQPSNQALWTRTTAFVGQSSSQFDRVDFAAFAHRRVERDAKESDQTEIGFFVVKDPNVDGKMDLVRREQAPIDLDPKRGGVVNVLVEDVEAFDVRYLDPLSGQWVESWDTTQATGQLNRLPIEIRIQLAVKGVRKDDDPFRYTTKFLLPMTQALTFGIPR